MELISHKVSDNHKIYLLGDIHKGVLTHHDTGFEKVIDKINKEKDSYVIIMGDLVEGRPLNHKYFDMDIADPKMLLPENQYEAFKEIIRPIKNKIITILEGNHDRGLSRLYGNKVKTICKELKIPFGTFSSIVTLRDKKNKQRYKIYVTHGAGRISSTAGDIIRKEGYMKEAIKRKLKNKASDCIGMFMGHTHKLMVAEPMRRLYMVSDDKKLHQVYSKRHGRSIIIPEDDRWYGNTGSFMKALVKGVSTYSEQAMYDPVEMGYILVHGKGDDIENVETISL